MGGLATFSANVIFAAMPGNTFVWIMSLVDVFFLLFPYNCVACSVSNGAYVSGTVEVLVDASSMLWSQVQ